MILPAHFGAAGVGMVWGWYIAGYTGKLTPLRTFGAIVVSSAGLALQSALFGSLPAFIAFGAGLLLASTAHLIFRAQLRAHASTI